MVFRDASGFIAYSVARLVGAQTQAGLGRLLMKWSVGSVPSISAGKTWTNMAIMAASLESLESPVGPLFMNSYGAYSRRLPDGSVIQLWKSAGWGGSWHPDGDDPFWTTHGQDTPEKVWEDLLEWVFDCEKELREAQDKAWKARRIGTLLDSPKIPQPWWDRVSV